MLLNFISSTPIATFKNNDRSEHDYFYNLEYKNNGSFDYTTNSYVLSNTKLKTWIQNKLSDYAIGCLATYQKLNITQSWCIKFEDKKANIFKHSHPNSIVSGAYYIKCNQDSAKLKLDSTSLLSEYQIYWEKDPNLISKQHWLWSVYDIPVEEGLLVIFPSAIKHSVESTIDKDNRCVLSFNTWFQGDIGNDELFTKLKVTDGL